MSNEKEEPLKSAYELAMERLRSADKEQGIEQAKPLSAAQKEEIARLRSESRAKAAELEILKQKDLIATGGDPEKLAEVERKYQIDRARVESRLESAIERVRAGKKARLDED
jgi:hypothetical protein